jgi:hypothetical protein
MSESHTALRGDRSIAYLALLPSAVILMLLVAVPTITVVILSMQDVGLGEVSGRFVGFDNFVWVLSSRSFYRALTNTLVWVFGCVGLDMMIGLGIALLLNQSFAFRGIARAVALAPYLIPTIVAVLVWRYMFHDIVGSKLSADENRSNQSPTALAQQPRYGDDVGHPGGGLEILSFCRACPSRYITVNPTGTIRGRPDRWRQCDPAILAHYITLPDAGFSFDSHVADNLDFS